jgi:ATP-dependent DNA helicase RecG
MPTESHRLETKQSLAERDGIVETVAAFATADGGVIRVGVRPDGERVGVQLGRGTLENLANEIKQNTEPPQYPLLQLDEEGGPPVIVVEVQASPIKPVWAFGRPYKRVGRTNQRLSPEETQRLVEVTTGRTWDAWPCEDLSVADLDREAARKYLRRADLDPDTPTETVLRNLGLLTARGIGNGAALLFAENPQRFAVDAQTKCGRFLGTDSVDFLDEQTLDGTVLSQLDAALTFIARNTRQAIRITGRPERERVPEYPDEALREALVNALCHRDYAMPGTVQVRIYDSRLEVWNPGRLSPELTIDDLYRPHGSYPRNRLLAQAFHRAGLIEAWGTGTLRIIRACEAVGMARPEYDSLGASFVVRFASRFAENGSPEPLVLTDRQKRVLAHAREHGAISSRECVVIANVTQRQAQRELKVLRDAGVLLRRGRGAQTSYSLPDGDSPAS